MNKKNILTFIIIFLALNFIFSLFNKPPTNETKSDEISLQTVHKEFGLGDLVTAEFINNTSQTYILKNTCPNEPLEVLAWENGQWSQKTKNAGIPCEGVTDLAVKPNEKYQIAFTSWNHALFGQTGRYKLRANLTYTADKANTGTQETTQGSSSEQTQTVQTTEEKASQQPTATQPPDETGKIIQTRTLESSEFEIKPQGWFGYFWTTLFYQPLYNVLIFLVSIVPWNDLGLGIILLTIIIRTILLIPSQNALKSQRKLQEIQPKLARIREKYKNNQEMIAKETMAIWKEHKVNPFGSCLPLIIQFPVLIALFYVVQNGLNPDNGYLLYGSLQQFVFSKIHVNFLNILDLTKINIFVLPLIVGALQFLQMKLAMVRNKSKEEQSHKKEKSPKAKNEMQIANNTMLYIMPVMIAVFTASVPAGVGLYWSVSTLYGIGQQLVVNRQSDQDKSKVRVLKTP